MSYYYEKQFGAEGALRIETVMRQSYTTQKGGQAVYTALRSQGLGYRKTELLNDYRKFQAVDPGKTPEAQARAETWYEKVYEPLRKERKWTAKQTSEFLRMITKGTQETIEQAEAIGEYAELYEQHF